MSAISDEIKKRAVEQWTANPCGAEHGKAELGTREFFQSVADYRYGQYAPWMREAMGFDQFAGKRLLEVGCGMGTDLLQFARGGAIVTGLDLTPRSVSTARHHLELYGCKGDFVIGDAENLSFPDNYFDVVYSNGVLHHTPDTQRAVNEIYRVLKKGGIAKVMLYYKHSLNYWKHIIIKRGILQGQLLDLTPEEIMSRYVEYSEVDARPLVKVFTRAQARKLFERFTTCRIEINQLTRGEVHLPEWALPDRWLEKLARKVGWNLIMTAVK